MRIYDTYKDSGISWLGQIPSHWDVKRLGSYFTERRQKVSDKDYEPLSVTKLGIFPQLENVAKTNDGDNRKLVRKGDFVINSRSDRKGSSGVSELDGSVSLINIVLEPHQSIIPAFCNFLLKSHGFIEEYYRIGRGIVADLWTTRYQEMKFMPLAVPPLAEQEAIVAYLDSATAEIDKAIASQQRMVELLQERKQIIINQAVTQGLNPDAPMKPTNIDWLPQIPTHWDIKKLKHVSSLFGRIGFRGYSTSDLTDMEHGAITLSPSNMIDGKMNFDNCSFLSWDKYFESPEIMVKEGDILFVKTGSTYGKSAIVETLPKESTINPQILIITNISIHSKYLYYLLRTPIITNQVETIVIGGTIPTISQTKIGNMSIIIPPISEQKEIVNYIESAVRPIDEAISCCEQKIALLTERKQILINDVVTGKIKVS